MKYCSKCKILKSLSEFSPRYDRPAGQYKSFCKECISKYVKAKYYGDLPASREIIRQRAKARVPNKEANAKSAKQYAANFPERKRASAAVKKEIRSGRMARLPCMLCGEEKSHAHHSSYAPDMHLAVTWLCLDHHMQAHRKEWRGE